jgi:hypothetical protein
MVEVERDRWDRTIRTVFHPGAPRSLSPQQQMPDANTQAGGAQHLNNH